MENGRKLNGFNSDQFSRDARIGVFLIESSRGWRNLTFPAANLNITEEDSLLELHIPGHAKRKHNCLKNYPSSQRLEVIRWSLHRVANYMIQNDFTPSYIYGTAYEPMVTIAQRQFGFNVIREHLPDRIIEKVRTYYTRNVNQLKCPARIGLVYLTGEEFLSKFSGKVDKPFLVTQS